MKISTLVSILQILERDYGPYCEVFWNPEPHSDEKLPVEGVDIVSTEDEVWLL